MRPTNQRLKELIASARADIRRTNSLDKRAICEEEIAIMEELLMWRGEGFDTMVLAEHTPTRASQGYDRVTLDRAQPGPGDVIRFPPMGDRWMAIEGGFIARPDDGAREDEGG